MEWWEPRGFIPADYRLQTQHMFLFRGRGWGATTCRFSTSLSPAYRKERQINYYIKFRFVVLGFFFLSPPLSWCKLREFIPSASSFPPPPLFSPHISPQTRCYIELKAAEWTQKQVWVTVRVSAGMRHGNLTRLSNLNDRKSISIGGGGLCR